MSKQNEKSVISPMVNDIKTVLIVNPSSSSGSTGKNWNDFYLKVKEFFGENPEIAFTTKAGDGTTMAREYLQKGFKNIVAIGGDGTINEVANGFFIFNEEQRGGQIEDDNNKEKKIGNMAYPPPIKQINPDSVFGIISSGTRNILVKTQ